ncbi:MAG: hypothetical protein ACLSAP_12485 [Oscillospiraceae bacterium]
MLYRNNTSAVPVADALSNAGIDFYIKEHRVSFFRHFVVTDMLCFFSLSYDLSDLRSFEKIYYKLGAYPRDMFEAPRPAKAFSTYLRAREIERATREDPRKTAAENCRRCWRESRITAPQRAL